MRGGGKGYRVSCPVPSPPSRKVTNEALRTTSKNPSPQEVQTLALWRFIYKKEREKKAMEECFALTHTHDEQACLLTSLHPSLSLSLSVRVSVSITTLRC